MYFERAIFRRVGNIVGFTNSSKSPRNYSPVMKSVDRIAKATSICIGGASGFAFGAYNPLRNRK
jgi:hypothetical protein